MRRLASALAALLFIAHAATAAQYTTPQVGNGYVATFINSTDVYVAGVFNGNSSNSQRAAFPATTRIFVSGAENLQDYTLSVADATVRLNYNMGNVDATHEWYAHRTLRNLLIEDIHVTTRTFGNITVPLVDLGISGGDPSDYSGTTIINSTLVPILGKFLVANVTQYLTVDPEYPTFFGQVYVCSAVTVAPAAISVVGSTGYLRIITSYCTSVPADDGQSDTCACAIAKLEYAVANPKGLKKMHDDAWMELWSHKVIFVPTDNESSSSSGSAPSPSPSDSSDNGTTTAPTAVPKTPAPTKKPYEMVNASVLQSVVDASFYAILSSMRDDFPYSSSPGGLPTNGYRGHTFWDMETWMLPNMLIFHPAIATGSAIQYRLNRLAGAQNNAAEVAGGTEGFAFPWESAFSGYDVCPWSQGEHTEIHITADVVGAWRLYYSMSGDDSFLQTAFPAINGTAAYWLSRSVRTADGAWHINGVTPPDEYHMGNDSIYTNFAVATIMNFTLQAAEILNVSLPKMFAHQLAEFGANVTLLYNATGDYHPEFLGYKGDLVKQADVVMLSYPWGMEMNETTMRNDLLYYGIRTDPLGPAMTWSMFAVGHLALGDTDEAMEYFLNGFVNNAFPPYYAWYEVAGGSGCPNFITGAGGFLQSIWAGLAGIRYTYRTLTVTSRAHIPETLQEIKLQNIHFLQSEITIRLVRMPSTPFYSLRVSLVNAGPIALTCNNVKLLPGFEVITLLTEDISITG